MVNIEATTPQLRVVKGLADALVSRDLSNAEPILSKDFILKSFPKAAELPDLTKEEYLQKYSAVLALFGKMEIVFHEVIEAPEKVVLHLTFFFTTVDGTTVDYDSVFVCSFVDEDGELKLVEAKDFADPGKRGVFHLTAAKVLAQGTAAA